MSSDARIASTSQVYSSSDARLKPYTLADMGPDAWIASTSQAYSASDARLKPYTLADMTPDAWIMSTSQVYSASDVCPTLKKADSLIQPYYFVLPTLLLGSIGCNYLYPLKLAMLFQELH